MINKLKQIDSEVIKGISKLLKELGFITASKDITSQNAKKYVIWTIKDLAKRVIKADINNKLFSLDQEQLGRIGQIQENFRKLGFDIDMNIIREQIHKSINSFFKKGYKPDYNNKQEGLK